MKTITCLDCEKQFQGEGQMEVLTAMHKHYVAEHNEIISQVSETGKKEWMEEFGRRWENAQ